MQDRCVPWARTPWEVETICLTSSWSVMIRGLWCALSSGLRIRLTTPDTQGDSSPGGCWAGADHRHMCKLCWTLVVVASTVWGSWGPRISGRVKTAKSAAAEFPTVGKTHQPVGKTHRLVGAISAVGDSAVGTRFRDTVSGNPEIPKISCTLYIKGEVPRDVKFPRKPGATAPGMDGQAPSPGGAVAM